MDVRCDAWSIGNSVRQASQKKTYLIAFADDDTRVILNAQLPFAKNTRELLAMFKVVLFKRGVPKRMFMEYLARHIFHRDTLMPSYVIEDFGDRMRTTCATADQEEHDFDKVDFDENAYRRLEHGVLNDI